MLTFASVAVQVLVLGPTQAPEGPLPVTLKRDNLVFTCDLWERFHSKYPHVSFEYFWNFRLRKYEERNASSKEFWASF